MTRHRYTVVIEKGAESYGAFVPDLPGCVAVAKTRAAATRMIRDAIVFHLEGLREQGIEFPRPNARVAENEVAVGQASAGGSLRFHARAAINRRTPE